MITPYQIPNQLHTHRRHVCNSNTHPVSQNDHTVPDTRFNSYIPTAKTSVPATHILYSKSKLSYCPRYQIEYKQRLDLCIAITHRVYKNGHTVPDSDTGVIQFCTTINGHPVNQVKVVY